MKRRFRPTPWSSRLPIEAALTVGIAATLYAWCLHAVQPVLVKARLTEVLGAFGTQTVDVMEDAALHGGYALGRVVDGEAAGQREDIEDALGLRRTAAAAVQSDEAAEIAGSRYSGAAIGQAQLDRLGSNFSYTLEGTRIVATGQVPGMAQRFHLSFSPAVVSDGPSWNVIWLCGDRAPPRGWVTLRDPLGTLMPRSFLYSFCRGNEAD